MVSPNRVNRREVNALLTDFESSNPFVRVKNEYSQCILGDDLIVSRETFHGCRETGLFTDTEFHEDHIEDILDPNATRNLT